MKRYICARTIISAVLSGVIAGIAASFALSPLRSLAIGAVIAVLAFFAIPSHFAAKDRIFNKEADKLGELYLNEPILILTNKKMYRARICASDEVITILFFFKGRVFSIPFRKSESPSLSFNEVEGTLSIACEHMNKGACVTSGALLRNIYDIAEALKAHGWI